VWGAAAVALAAGSLFAVNPQARLHHDGCWMLWHHASGEALEALHLLHLPLAALLGNVLGPDRLLAAPALLSALCAGIGLFASALFWQRIGVRPGRALSAAAVVAATPALAFWATQIDVHAVHFAGVALALLFTTYAAERTGALGVALGALAAALPVATHQSAPLLGFGFVFLFLRLRGGRTTLGGVLRTGVVFAAAMAAVVVLSSIVRTGTLPFQGGFFGAGHGGEQLFLIRAGRQYFEHEGAGWGQWWRALHALAPLALLGLVRARGERLWTFAFLAPATAFFLWWSVPEQGGYFVHQLPVLGYLLVRAVPRGFFGFLILVVVLVINVRAGLATVRAFDAGFDPARRAAIVRELAGEGTRPQVLGFVQDLPAIGLWVEGAERDVRAPELVEACLQNLDPAWFADVAVGTLASEYAPAVWAQNRPLLIDLSNPGSFDRIPTGPVAEPYLQAIGERLALHFQVTWGEGGGWRIVRLDPRP